MNLRVTAVIPTFNRPAQFRRALESVLAQTKPANEIVIGDDASQQEVRSICESYNDARIVYLARRSTQRMSENWDFVMRWAPEGLVALLEDDNVWLPNHLENAARLFNRFSRAGIYHAGHKEAWDRNGSLEIYKTFFPPWHERLAPAGGGIVSSKDVVMDALLCGSINSSTVVIRRPVLNDVPGFDYRYLMGMDTLMWTRIAMAHPCIYAPSIDTIYTYHGKNVSTEEVATRRAGSQARASRRLILAEAIGKNIVREEEIESLLYQAPPSQAAGVLTMLAHRNTSAELRRMAKEVWSARPEAKASTGYLRVSQKLGFWILTEADRFDLMLGLFTRIRRRLAGS